MLILYFFSGMVSTLLIRGELNTNGIRICMIVAHPICHLHTNQQGVAVPELPFENSNTH